MMFLIKGMIAIKHQLNQIKHNNLFVYTVYLMVDEV